LLRDLEASGRTLSDLTAQEWAAFGVPDGASLLDPDVSVAARSSRGGPAPDSVHAQADAIDRLVRDRPWTSA
jgi:argininosuccinate lyase